MIQNGFFILIFAFFILSNSFRFNVVYGFENLSNFRQIAQEMGEAPDSFYLCKKNKSVRWLRLLKQENGKCQTTYSKDGFLQIISAATYYSICDGVLHNVKRNLEEGGYKCEASSQFQVMELK